MPRWRLRVGGACVLPVVLQRGRRAEVLPERNGSKYLLGRGGWRAGTGRAAARRSGYCAPCSTLVDLCTLDGWRRAAVAASALSARPALCIGVQQHTRVRGAGHVLPALIGLSLADRMQFLGL